MNSQIINMSRLFFLLGLLLTIASCKNLDETLITEVEEPGDELVVTDAWICDIKSYEDESWFYEIYVQENGDYIAVSPENVLRVSSDGTLNAVIKTPYTDEYWFRTRVFNNKIYRFYNNNDFQNFDPNESIKVEIYDLDLNLLSDQELDTKGLIYDAEVEGDNLFGLLVYDPDQSTMTLKKIDLNSGLVVEKVLSTSGTTPNNLQITEDGFYICSASSNKNNLFLFDNDLNARWANEFDQYVISDAEYVAGRGIYITGRVASSLGAPRPTFIALIDMNGNEVTAIDYDAGERWSPFIASNDDKICVTQTEPESGLNMMMSILDFDLNVESSIDIEGNVVQSDIIVNENNSFSFVYGIAIDPDSEEFFPERNTRIFKFDESYTIPTNIIIQ